MNTRWALAPRRVFISCYLLCLTTACTVAASQRHRASREVTERNSNSQYVMPKARTQLYLRFQAAVILCVVQLHAWDMSWWCVSQQGRRHGGVRCGGTNLRRLKLLHAMLCHDGTKTKNWHKCVLKIEFAFHLRDVSVLTSEKCKEKMNLCTFLCALACSSTYLWTSFIRSCSFFTRSMWQLASFSVELLNTSHTGANVLG